MATTPSIAMIPSGYKTGKLYSVLPTNGDGDFDFARSTTATRVNKDGLIEEVAVNVPRLDYSDGTCPSLLLEPQSTNKFSYSEDFNNSAWTKSGNTFVYSSSTISPDGTLNGTLVEGATDLILGGNNLNDGLGASGGLNYILTAYVKSKTATKVGLALRENGGGTFSRNEDIPITTNEWKRISVNISSPASANSLFAYFGGSDGDFYIWGAQLEQGSYATSYIPTQGSAVTRVADSSSQTVPSGIIGQTEGTLFIEYPNINDLYAFIGLSINGNNNNRMIIYSSGNNILNAQFRQGAAIKLSGISSLITGKVKGALSFSSTESVFYVNGTQITVGTAAAWSGLNQVDFNQSNQIGAKVSEIKYYNTRLSNAELAALTTL